MRDLASQLLMVGLSHDRMTLEELGRTTVRPGALPGALADLVAAGFAEAVVISTCSRTEIYAATTAGAAGAELGRDALAAWSGLPGGDVLARSRARTGRDAVDHLFRVTAGLESRLTGDVDVLAQVRLAWRAARDAGTAGPLLGRLFPAAIRAAEKAHAETALGRQGRSLAKRAVDVGLATFEEAPHHLEALVIGSGQMASVACQHLASTGTAFEVAARDERYAAQLAGADSVCSLDALVEGVRRADLVLCATSAAHHVLTLRHVVEATAGRERPLTVVDLAIPPNVDVEVGALPGVHLVQLTALGDDARRDPAMAAAVAEATSIVGTAARQFCDDHAAAAVGRVIQALRASVHRSCLEQLRRHGGVTDPASLTRAAHGLAGKVAHRPTMLARAAAAAGDRDTLVLLCEAFDVPAEDVLGPRAHNAHP